MDNAHIVYHNPRHLPNDDIKKVVIWLHGMSGTATSFKRLVPLFNLSQAVKFIFVEAPIAWVSVQQMLTTSWFDIKATSQTHRAICQDDLNQSVKRIVNIINAEQARGVALGDVVLAGFSQGGAVAYHVAIHLARQGQFLGGLLALSAYLVMQDEVDLPIAHAQQLPIFMAHGSLDTIVSPAFADNTKTALERLGFLPILKYYPIAHGVAHHQIKDIAKWLDGVVCR